MTLVSLIMVMIPCFVVNYSFDLMFLWFSWNLNFVIFPVQEEEKDKEAKLWVDEEMVEEIYGKSGLELERKRYKVMHYEFMQVTLLLFRGSILNCQHNNFYYFRLE
jgi:hypothetical protein